MTEVKAVFLSVLGAIGGAIAYALGGWDNGITTLCIFMVVDFGTGFICAAVFKASPKTASGALNSWEMAKGFFKKVGMLCLVAIAQRLDLMLGCAFVRDAVVIAFCASELLSIVENAGRMGIPIPKIIIRAIDLLQHKADALVDSLSKQKEVEDNENKR